MTSPNVYVTGYLTEALRQAGGTVLQVILIAPGTSRQSNSAGWANSWRTLRLCLTVGCVMLFCYWCRVFE